MRDFSVPERIAGFGVAVAAVVAAYPAVHRIVPPCPLRWLTGVPCPLCGMTTAAVGLARGDLGAALSANPFVFGLAALVTAGAVLVVIRAAGLVQPPVPWSPAARRRCGWLVGVLAVASWAFQLHRLGYV